MFSTKSNIAKYNVLIDGRNFYDQPISDQIRKYDEVRMVAFGKGETIQQDVCWIINILKITTNQLHVISVNKKK